MANANGDAYTLGNDHVLYRWEGASWKAIGSGHIDLSVSAGGDAHTLGNDNAVYRWVGNRWKIVQRFGLTLAQRYAQGRDTLVSDISHDLRRQIAGLPGNVKNVSVTSLQLVGDKIKGDARLTLGQDWGEYFSKRVRATRDFPVSFTHNTITGHTEMTGINQLVDLSVTVSGRKFGTQFKLTLDLGLFNQVFDLYDRAVRPTLKHLSGATPFAAKVDTPIPSLKLSAPKVPSRVLPAVKVPSTVAAIPSVELPHIVKDPAGWVTNNVIEPGLESAKQFSDESRRLGGDIAREGKKLGGDIAREGKKGLAYVQDLIADAFGQVPDGFDQPLKAFEKIMGSFSRFELEVPGLSAAFDKLSSVQRQADPDVALALPDLEKLQQFNSGYLKDELLATFKEKVKQFTGIFSPDYTTRLVDQAGDDLGIVLGYDSASKMVKAGFNSKFVWMKFEFTIGYQYFWEPANPDRWRAVATTSAGIKDSNVRVEYEYSTGRGEEFPDVIRQSAGYKDKEGASAAFDQWAHVEFNPKSQDVHFGPINIELKADSGQFGIGVSAIQEHKSGQLTALRPNNIWFEARTGTKVWTVGGRLTLQYVPIRVTEDLQIKEQHWGDVNSWDVIITPQLGFNNVRGWGGINLAIVYDASNGRFVNAAVTPTVNYQSGLGNGRVTTNILIDENGNVDRIVVNSRHSAPAIGGDDDESRTQAPAVPRDDSDDSERPDGPTVVCAPGAANPTCGSDLPETEPEDPEQDRLDEDPNVPDHGADVPLDKEPIPTAGVRNELNIAYRERASLETYLSSLRSKAQTQIEKRIEIEKEWQKEREQVGWDTLDKIVEMLAGHVKKKGVPFSAKDLLGLAKAKTLEEFTAKVLQMHLKYGIEMSDHADLKGAFKLYGILKDTTDVQSLFERWSIATANAQVEMRGANETLSLIMQEIDRVLNELSTVESRIYELEMLLENLGIPLPADSPQDDDDGVTTIDEYPSV